MNTDIAASHALPPTYSQVLSDILNKINSANTASVANVTAEITMSRDIGTAPDAASPSKQLHQKNSLLNRCTFFYSRCSIVAKAIGSGCVKCIKSPVIPCCITTPFCLCSAITLIPPGTITIIQEISNQVIPCASGSLLFIPGALIGSCWNVIQCNSCSEGCQKGGTGSFVVGWKISELFTKLVCNGIIGPIKWPLNCVGLAASHIACVGYSGMFKNDDPMLQDITCVWCHVQSALELFFARKAVQETCGIPCGYDEDRYVEAYSIYFEEEFCKRLYPSIFLEYTEPKLMQTMVRCCDDS